MALDDVQNWRPYPHTYNESENGGDLVITDNQGNKYYFKVSVETYIPLDEDGTPTISKQNINRGKGLMKKVTIEGLEESGIVISRSMTGSTTKDIIEGIVLELSLDIEGRKEDIISNEVALFLDDARKRAYELSNND